MPGRGFGVILGIREMNGISLNYYGKTKSTHWWDECFLFDNYMKTAYQILIRWSSGLYILSPAFTLKAW
jgi:hypothetical protein